MGNQNPNDKPSNDPIVDPVKPPTPGENGDKTGITFTEDQQKAIDRMMGEARRDGRKAAEDAADEAKRKAEADAEVARQIAAGEFETARKTIEDERDAAVADRDAYKARIDTLVAAIKPTVDAAWTELPDEVRDLYDGADDDVIAKQSHITRHAKLIARLTAGTDQAKKIAAHGRTPAPDGDQKPERKTVGTIRF